MKPLLLVDVDGVINCFGSLWSPEYEAEHFEPIWMQDGQFSIRVRKQLRDRLHALLPHFEPVWCTAWMERAHPAFHQLLGLPEASWPVIEFVRWNGNLAQGRSWKWPWVDEYLGDRPAAWIDDDFGDPDYEWAAQRTQEDCPTLLVQTNPCFGLVDENVRCLIGWVESIA